MLAEGQDLGFGSGGGPVGDRRRHQLHLGHTLGQFEGGLERVGQPALDALALHQPVDDHLDCVLLVPGQLGQLSAAAGPG